MYIWGDLVFVGSLKIFTTDLCSFCPELSRNVELLFGPFLTEIMNKNENFSINIFENVEISLFYGPCPIMQIFSE